MGNAIKYQASIFGDFQTIDLSTEAMQKLFAIFLQDNLVPSVLKEFNMLTQSIINRPNFVSQDNKISISFASDRIDIIGNPNIIGTHLQLDDFLLLVNKYHTQILKLFDLSINRIAYVEEIFLSDINPNIFMDIINNKYIYNKEKVFEWAINNVALEEWLLFVGKAAEKVNINTTLSKRKIDGVQNNIPIKLDTTILSIDINTIAENNKPRFNIMDINQFYVKAKEAKRNVEIQIEGAIIGK